MSGAETDLLRIAALLRERALSLYRRDLEAERALRAGRDAIDGLRRDALVDGLRLGAHQMLGMGMLWQGELQRRRTALQLGIAEARARQGYSGALARDAFSREEAARRIVESVRKARADRRLAADERGLENLAALRMWRADEDGEPGL
ncbi:hypothetical protein [Alloyangia pacifica]|uniref:Uncharacterized protein n=1 Tax=Alloyangia pacifica TaxID=311180 RepID=A0A1I6U0V4_9RHOB|nr:hypothetical protein [Alloyangia pacifica]SDH32437.1 hypothetical protein SAMN04488245_10732 [Alloyangia pacifica]SFS94988.1 hypothetical protein SAMN04488050_10732 [Alloyangia pacifica]